MAYKDKADASRYNTAFQAKTYDRIQILPTKAEGQTIRQAATEAGQSVSAYILDAVRRRIAEDNKRDT